MGQFKLVAIGDHAKQLTMCDGGPDLLLWQDRPIQLGRAVREGDGYRYPNQWNSLSSRHCNLQFQADGAEGQWLVTDTSTNGTYINGTKIGKNNSAVLRAGDRLGLSIMATTDSAASFVNSVEYQLEYDADASTPHAPVVAPAASHVANRAQQPAAAPAAAAHAGHPAAVAAQAASHKRRQQEGSVSPGAQPAGQQGVMLSAGPKKRPRNEEAEAPELVQLRKSNQELRGKLEDSRQELERVEQQLHDAEAHHRQALQERDQQHHEQLASAERAAAEALESERGRTKQLQQQLAELTASSAEQQRQLSVQLTESNQQLAAKTEEATRLSTQLQHAQEGIASRDADVARLQQELLQEQRLSSELKLQLVQAKGATAALEEAQQQLQARSEALMAAQQALREEQGARGAAEASARAAEKALERAKTSLQEKLDSEKENLLVYGRSVQEAHADLAQKLLVQQAEQARHQQETEQLNAQLRALLDKLTAESARHSSAVQGLVQGVDEGLQTLTAAGVEARFDDMQADPVAAAADGQDVEMEGAGNGQEPDAAGQSDSQQQAQDAPLTQAINSANQPSGSNPNTNSTPHQSQTGGSGIADAGSTPAATQEQPAGSARGGGVAGPLTATAAVLGTPRVEGQLAGTEAADDAGQTQEVFPATMAFPVLATAAAAGPTLALFGTPVAPGSAPAPAPAPTPATAAGGAAGAVAAAGGSALLGGVAPASLQQQFQERLSAVLLEQELLEQELGAQGVQEELQGMESPRADQKGGLEPNGAAADGSRSAGDAAAAEPQQDVVEGSQETGELDGQLQQQQQEEEEDEEEGLEVAETPQDDDLPGQQGEMQEQEPAANGSAGKHDPANPVVAAATADTTADAAAAAAQGVDADVTDAVEAEGCHRGDADDEGSEQLGCTDEDPSSSLRGGPQQQQHDQDVHGSEQQQQGHSQDQAWLGWSHHQQPCTYPQQKQRQVKSLLGSSGSPGRPQSQPMGSIDLNQQLPVNQGMERDPYTFRG